MLVSGSRNGGSVLVSSFPPAGTEQLDPLPGQIFQTGPVTIEEAQSMLRFGRKHQLLLKYCRPYIQVQLLQLRCHVSVITLIHFQFP
jgi:hypothetical protein